MKLHTTLMASCAFALAGTIAMADCAADLAQLKTDAAGEGHGGGISKDGTLAPLETTDAAEGSEGASSDAVVPTAGNGEASSEGIAKDGSLAPLEGTEAEANSSVAMSGQDAQAQQGGEPTAAEIAEDGAPSADTADATLTENGSAADGTTAATTGSSDRSALLAEAQAALDAGDEEACLAALGRIGAP